MGEINLQVCSEIFSCPLSSWSGKLFILGTIPLASFTGPHDLVGGFQEILASK